MLKVTCVTASFWDVVLKKQEFEGKGSKSCPSETDCTLSRVVTPGKMIDVC